MEYEKISVEPLGGTIGAEIDAGDLRKLDNQSWSEIHQAFLEYHVLVFRKQELTPADIMQFSARFGEATHYPFAEGIEGYPFIFDVVKEPAETKNFGGGWHSDTTYLPKPPLATLLYAIETPPKGGDTLFANTAAAYDALSPGMKDMIDRLHGVNSGGLKLTGGRRTLHSKIDGMKIRNAADADNYEATHPIARTHPETGRKAIYCGRVHTVRFEGMTEQESRPLIDFLASHQMQPEFTCRVSWKPGTLTVWDNRCTQHNAINDYQGARRQMRRITVGAQVPM